MFAIHHSEKKKQYSQFQNSDSSIVELQNSFCKYKQSCAPKDKVLVYVAFTMIFEISSILTI